MSRSLLATLVSLALFAPLDARAARVTWTIQDVLSGVSPDLGSLGLVNGAPYVYELVYESSTPEDAGNPDCCSFLGAVLAVSFRSGAFEVALAPGQTESMGGSGNNFAASGPVYLQMIDTHPAVGATLPIAPPVYAGTQISLLWGNPYTGTGFLIYTSAAHMSYRVPEPALAWLPLALVAALAWRRRG